MTFGNEQVFSRKPSGSGHGLSMPFKVGVLVRIAT